MVDCACIATVLSPVLQVAGWLAAPIGRQFKYLFNYKANFDNLQEEVNNLKIARDEVQREVTAAERNVKEINQNVKKWQKDVEKTITEAERLIKEMCKRCAREHYRMVTEADRNMQEGEQEPLIPEKANNRRCFKGFCPNFIFHYKQSKKAFKLKRDDIDPLLEQGKNLGPISYQINPPEIWLRSSENYLAFESRNSTVKEVWDALNDENVFMIGVYGMGGLGKTTLVQEAGRKANEKKQLFGDIVFVEVSESPDIKQIQTVIAENLGLKFESESERAKKLCSRMEGKNILLILDNIWEPLEFEKIGIPCGAERGKNKLLFTTRNLDVLERMGSTNNFGMGILNEEEAWTLFSKMAALTDNVIQTPELRILSNDVCKECGGLPIVICTIGKLLRNKTDPFFWRARLQELRAPSPKSFIGLLEKEYMKMALSYKHLRNDELKKTFLIASLLENNTSISKLFKHVVCLNILEGVNLTMENARDKLDALVRELKDACLLLDGVKSGQIAMHDVVRVVATTIAYLDHHVFTSRNDFERDWMDKDKLKEYTKISLSGKSTIISQPWPKYLDCPNLEYFYMTDMRNSSFEIPEGFFTMMPKLRVLNLVRLQQKSLPPSIRDLTSLQTLCLDKSNIEGVPIIGELKKLKVLSLRGSCIEEFPTEMSQLTQLRLLDLSNCYRLKVIAPNVISKLSNLEELYLKGCPIQWKIEELEDLELLRNLTSVELDIKDDKVLPKAFFSRELKRYKISVGSGLYLDPRIGERECLRILKLIYNSTIYLEELCGIKNVESLCLAEYLDDLRSNEITPLFNKKVIFPGLKVLVLMNIISRKIWDNQLPSSSFKNLKELILWGCTMIKYVFSYTITKNLHQLQYLVIKDCIDLEEIVATEEITEAAASSVFSQLTALELENLPKLATFCPGIHISEWLKLKCLVVRDCDKFKLFNSEPNSSGLDKKINHDLEVFELKTQSIEISWDRGKNSWNRGDKDLKISRDKSANIPLPLFQRFQSLEELKLYDCEYKEIKSVFDLPNLNVLRAWSCSKLVSLVPSSPSTARSLVQLKELSIWHCGMLAEILENKGDATTIEIVFQKLTKLSLDSLESLTCFCSGNHSLNFPSLEELIITNCRNMDTFFREISKVSEFTLQSNEITPFFNQKVHFRDLKVLELKNISFEKIWDSQFSTSAYQNLTHLTLCGCDKIKYVFPLSIAKSLQQLQYLELTDCKVLERIVASEEGTEATINFFFPQASTVKLQYLPEFMDLHTSEWPKLKEFMVEDCPKFKMFTSEPNSLCLDQKVHFRDLKDLKLKNISFEKIWDSQLSTSVYQNLTHLILCECDKIKYVFPLSIAKNLQQLQYLELTSCKVLERIVAPEEETEAAINFFFPQVSTVKLQYLPEFMDLHTSEMPKLKELVVEDCTKYASLKENNVETELNILAPKSIFLDNKIDHDLDIFQVKDDLGEISWWSQSKRLKISYYKSVLIPLWLLQRFENLTCLFVDGCHELVNLTTPSTARSLVQLRELEISNCKMLMEILEIEEDATTEIVFENLNKLSFGWMENLTCFCSGNYTFNFHSLKELNIAKCPNIKTFCRGILSTPKLQKISYEEMEVENEGNDLNKTIQELYKKEKQDISLDLNLKCKAFHHDNSMEIVYNQHPTSFYQNLTHLFLWKCGNIKYAFPSSIAKILHQLQQLKIQNCKALEEIVAKEDGANAVVDFVFPNITSLKFEDLPELIAFYPGSYALEMPKLKELVVKDCTKYASLKENNVETELNILAPKSIFLDNKDISFDLNLKCKAFHHDNSMEIGYNQHPSSFYQNLTHLFLWKCGNIKYAFPSSIAKSLHQLQQLKIQNCKVLEEIIAKEDGANAVVNFVFPNITLLAIEDLPELIAFYPGVYALEMPKLKELVVQDCTKYVNLKENNMETELNILDPKSNFLDNKINFSLELFELHDGEKEICWQSQSKTLRIIDYNSANISLRLLQRFENVRELQLSLSQYEDTKSRCDLPNLEILIVDYCHKLMSLVPFSTSFQNLKVLDVSFCNGLLKLITPSMARSLVQLRELSITFCEMLIEIVENEGDATIITEIVFNNLNKLSLKWLDSLTSFCSGNYSFSFPSLKELIIKNCPDLEIFCQGSICTSKLDKVICNFEDGNGNVNEVEIRDNDLNTTIQEEHQKQEWEKKMKKKAALDVLQGKSFLQWSPFE